MDAKLGLLFLISIGASFGWMNERPVLESQDGNLIISSAKDKNITLKTLGKGNLNINGINLLQVAISAQHASQLLQRLRGGYFSDVEDNLQRLIDLVEGPSGLQKRVSALEFGGDINTTSVTTNRPRPGSPSTMDSSARTGLRRMNDRLHRLEDKVRLMLSKLRENDCQSNPCLNGGVCQDLYDGYHCLCPANWEGPNCMSDVNECARFLGTDLGCQNGATCINSIGSYQCACPSGWFGLHCTKKSSACNAENSIELCGHGVCVDKPGSVLGYTCICDQGWETDGTNPGCTKDVDECAGNHPACSVNPMVTCINAPGTFYCGSCPHGYTGNGYYCVDIDECETDNGGCSTSPKVQCINTMGSRICGACPPGYQGDGTNCVYVGACRINNGGCHPLAQCIENPALTNLYVQCRCPTGYQGDGMGPSGCQPSTEVISTDCTHTGCVHGTCIALGNSHVCRCNAGYTGQTCSLFVNPCLPNPCRNNGTCINQNGEVLCDCPSSYTGDRCETSRQQCGGVSRSPIGHLDYPATKDTGYENSVNCAWVIITNHSLVLNVTFTAFNVEASKDCIYDFLQIHDGRTAAGHVLGRYCASALPNGGNIISTHNALYFWFHSDTSLTRGGFSLQWNSIEPVCGGMLTGNYGTIMSPGSPGKYPPGRDCFWHIYMEPGNRIQFHFGQIMLEEHPTCENDYVEITDEDNHRLGIYCNHSHPEPLTTSSHYAIVHFHSDSAGQDAGFQIHYTKTEGIPGCGGVLTAPTGMIATPLHTNMAYHANMNCEWKIQIPNNERIKLTWLSFSLEDSSECIFDAVEIHDGSTFEAPLIGRYCGDNLPPTIKSTSNSLLIKFTSDWSFQQEGFRISYETLCGGEFHEPSGVLTSPYYPEFYPTSRVCHYEIIQPPGKGIELLMVDMDIEGDYGNECYFDKLEIYDGDSSNSTSLAKLCGDSMPTQPYYSTHNYMFLEFSTDASIRSRGFKANYTTIDRRCGGLFKTSSGVIQSPSDDGYYENDDDCTWTIQAPPGNIIQLTFISFNIEYHFKCQSDYVKVYDNYTTAEQNLLGTYCGVTKPPILTSQSNVMTIIFKTDSSVIAEGFTASYLFIDATKVCGGHYYQQSGLLESPNFPNDYPQNRECVWVLEAPNRQQIMLHVKNFTLENHRDCIFDYLEIRNGGYETSPLLGKYCGTTIPQFIMSQTNQLYLKFVSDSSRPESGFSMEWDNSNEGCGGTLSSPTGDIMSPNYPQNYGTSSYCEWHIAASSGSVLRILFIDLDLEAHQRCVFDYVEVSEGSGEKRISNRFCGSSHPPMVETKSNTATIRFRSDYTTSGRGFHLRYETLCQNKLRGFQGVIESPNFPNKYDPEKNCSWIIEVPVGNRINISFSHFDLEGGAEATAESAKSCQFDYVEIKEGEKDVPNNILGKYCGTIDNVPSVIHSTLNQVFITFVTDYYLANNGFRLEWQLDGCGGRLTRPSDTFSSPGYPSVYSSNIDCEWLIEVEPTHSVELTLIDVDLESSKDCRFDSVRLYGGSDDTAPKLIEICRTTNPVIYNSPNNKMFVTFHSDQSVSGRGLQASYKSVPLTCGGKFISNSGVIHSANYPRNYPNSQNCEWLIEVDRNHVVNITFDDFDIEDSRNCTDDYVKIFDGATRDDPVLATHCKNELPPSYLSSGNQMLVVMRTDNFITAKGFKAKFIRDCGARIMVSDIGYFQTTFNDFHEHRHVNCTWILTAEEPGDHVTLTFTHMDMETPGVYRSNTDSCAWQYVKVYDGEGTNGPLRGYWCSNKIPPAITSNGRSLTVHVFAEYELGTNLVTATYSSLNSACGGNYTSESGTIASPGYPNSYPLNAECVWILNTSPGNRISLTFRSFDLQSSNNCDLDYLEIREESGVGKLIGTYCGDNADSITSETRLWLKFRSDEAGTAAGFLADYSFLHGNDLEGPTGRITSPLYPMPFRRLGTFFWRINVEFGWAIRIEFKNFRIENFSSRCYASLKVFDGYDEDAPLLVTACGLVKPSPIISSSNIVYLKLSTESFRQTATFDLTWIQIPRGSGETEEIKLSKCNEEISMMGDHNNTFRFNSPGWPEGYDHYLDCNWIFTSPMGTRLVFQPRNVDLEESYNCVSDSISVYSGYALTDTEDATLIKRICRSNETQIIASDSNIMTVKFKSDSYINGTGFNAVVHRDCGGKLGGPNGVIQIDNTTSMMRSFYFTCEWFVEVKAGRTIEVVVDHINMQESRTTDKCSNNYLLLRNGGDLSSPHLGKGKFCGDNVPEQMNTTGNQLYVKVVGQNRDIATLKLRYREVRMDCGGSYVLSDLEDQWIIKTPNYPNVPPPFSDCVWSVLASAGKRISIHFIQRFDLTSSSECEKEFVEIKDGGTIQSHSLGKFCGDTAPSTITSTSNMMFIHFSTEVSEPKNGFFAVITSDDVCAGVMRGTNGIISSPNYPHGYPKNKRCDWLIMAPVGHGLKLEFRDLNLPNLRKCENTDHVEIYEIFSENEERNHTSRNIIGTYCGLSKPSPIEISTNEAYITFVSDTREFSSYRGFSLNFTSSRDSCGGHLSAMSGIVKSPGYSNPRSGGMYCNWEITLPPGYQVTVDILDVDIPTLPVENRIAYSLSFYNDLRFKSRILKIDDQTSNETYPTQIQSSSNQMMIIYWSNIGNRGFKLRYTASAPAPCGELLNDVGGNITGITGLPFNETSYACTWKIEPPENMISNVNETGLTLTVKISEYRINARAPRTMFMHCFNMPYIALKGIGILCENITEPRYLRSAQLSNELTIVNHTRSTSTFHFKAEYQWQACGGVIKDVRHTIRAPKNLAYPINCMWEIETTDGSGGILGIFKKLNTGSCENGYIVIKNSFAPTVPIGKYCGNILPNNITNLSNKVFVEYYSAGEPNDFELVVNSVNSGCGGTLISWTGAITSPEFPKQYPNNAECVWNIDVPNGYHIGLTFVDRFNIQTSNNCEKDYVAIYDQLKNSSMGKSYQELGKVCGRNTPSTFNSTSSRMRVVFRSDETIQSDGFRAIWNVNCGGVFNVNSEQQIITSPKYPLYYPSETVCNYTLVAPDEDIIVEFTDFDLELGRATSDTACVFDNVTISYNNHYLYEEKEVYCGRNKPGLIRARNRIEIVFSTDYYVQRKGFKFKYFLNECGGVITQPTDIMPLMNQNNYFGNVNCTWIIQAPSDQSVTLRFEKFLLEYSSGCFFDSVNIYEGKLIDDNKKVGAFCGNLTNKLPVIKSEGSDMVVTFKADESGHSSGFSAKVLFSKSMSAGCGGNINLTSNQPYTFKTQKGDMYDSLEDCFWKVMTLPGKYIRFTISSIDLRNTTNITRSEHCSGDYLEVHDGLGPYSESFGKFCGTVVPLPIASTSHYMWIRLFTDGVIEGRGVVGTLEAIDSPCGLVTHRVEDNKQYLMSPGYPNSYSPGITCRWLLKIPETEYQKIHIRFIDFDMEDSNKCSSEFLQLKDRENHIIDEGFGENYVISGSNHIPISITTASLMPFSSYKYCGSQLPHEYYSYENDVEVLFKTTASGHKGFKLEYSTAKCDRNYTSEQGRIVHQGFSDCHLTIEAPENYTISLYFNDLKIYDNEQCTESGLEIRDGYTDAIVTDGRKLCGVEIPNPIFSTSNRLHLYSWSNRGAYYERYDITYTTTNKGPGCGGRLFNYGGRFTSPMYPRSYRNDSLCTWDVSVPQGFKVVLDFTVFDIGTKKNCANDHLTIYDVLPDSGPQLRTTFCGEDDPARMTASTNRVLVTYKTTVNNGGTGWVIVFVAQPDSKPIDFEDY